MVDLETFFLLRGFAAGPAGFFLLTINLVCQHMYQLPPIKKIKWHEWESEMTGPCSHARNATSQRERGDGPCDADSPSSHQWKASQILLTFMNRTIHEGA